MSLSITIIGHNEIEHLRELIPQLKWAKEIVYVDCESQDGSEEFAKNAGCRVFSRPNNANLNVNKSFAIGKATGNWIFYMDPDERLPKTLIAEIQKVILITSNSAFELNRRNYYFGNWLRNGSQYPDRQLRLFRKDLAHFPNKTIHEKLIVNGSIGRLSNDMLHFPYMDISQFLNKFDFYTGLEASYLMDAGEGINFKNSLHFLIIKPLLRFIRRYFLKGGFRDGFPGFFCALFDALNFAVRYFKLWELKFNQNPKDKN